MNCIPASLENAREVSMLLQTLELLDEVLGTPYRGRSPSSGLYYTCRYPENWKFEFVRISDYCENSPGDHRNWWCKEVADKLSTSWARHLRTSFRELYPQIATLAQGFPHGLVSLHSNRVLYASRPPPGGESLESKVTRSFGLNDQTRWEESRSENVLFTEKEALRALLCIPEDWPATKT